MKLAKQYHPDKKGGDTEKVINLFYCSLKKLVRLTKLSRMPTKEKCMISMAKMDLKWEEVMTIC